MSGRIFLDTHLMSCDFWFKLSPDDFMIENSTLHSIISFYYIITIKMKSLSFLTIFSKILQEGSIYPTPSPSNIHHVNIHKTQNASAARYSFPHHHYSIRAPRPNSSTIEATSITRIGIPTIGEYRVTPLLEFGQFFTNDIQI